MKTLYKHYLRVSTLLLLLCTSAFAYGGGVTIEKTINLTVGGTTTINPWSVVKSNTSGFSCISTKVMSVSDNTALSVSTGSTTKTSYPKLYESTGYSEGFYSTYKVQGLKAGSYTLNAYVYCTKREGYMPTTHVIGDYFVLYHVVVKEAPKVVSISIPNNLSLTVGDSYTFTPVISETGANTTLTWSSSNPSIVSVNNAQIKALSPGSSVITCTASNGVKAQCVVTVNPIYVTNIKLSKNEIDIEEGSRYNLYTTISPENATSKEVKWISSNENVAYVGTTGTVVGISSGYCNITAKATDGSNKSASCLVHVYKNVYTESITLDTTYIEIIKGEKITLKPKVTPSDVTNASLSWQSSNTSCATVDDKGIVTGLNEGTTDITVTTCDGTNLSASCSVKVKRNKYQILYKVNDEVYKTDSCLYGQQISVPEIPTLTGHTFKEWDNLPTTMPAYDIEVEARFTINTYTITYYLDDGFYKRDSIQFDDVISLAANPEKEGYSFSGWSKDSSTANEGIIDDLEDLLGSNILLTCRANDIPERMPAHNITLYGYMCINTYLLTYLVDGMTYRTDSVTFGMDITPIEAPIKQGYTFSGWQNVPDKMPAHNVTITGSFIEDGTGADSTALDNVIYINKVEAYTGQQLQLPINMKNTAAIRGFQFDLYLPEGVSVMKNNKGRILGSLNSERLPEEDEHTLTISEHSDGSIRFLCGSQYDDTFTGYDGEIITLSLQISDNMADGDYPVILRNIKLTETDISKFYEVSYLKSILTVSSYILGDINADGKIDVSDYIGVANHIMGNTPNGFIYGAADVDKNGSIDVSDYIGIANLIMTGTIYGNKSQSRVSIKGIIE